MLKIEEGKYYKTRDGRKVGPMQVRHCDSEHPFEVDDGVWIFERDGTNYAERPLDLIAEWTDGPVVTETVTKTRIVPGVYAGFTVGAVTYDGRKVHVVQGDDEMWTSDELDAAAAVLSALAKGLRDA